jgi:predicted RND superfamily exporter protein
MMIPFRLFIIIFLSIVMLSCISSSQRSDSHTPKIDRISAEELTQVSTKPSALLSLDDIVSLTKEGQSTDQIIQKIRSSNSSYDLTPSQVIALNKQGVDNKVLDYIHTDHELAVRNNVTEEMNQLAKIKQAELDKLKQQQWQLLQQRMYNPACGYGFYGQPYGFGAFNSRFGYRSRFGVGIGFPLGCW